jgi:formate dehydrogenase assembly factor FdhD
MSATKETPDAAPVPGLQRCLATQYGDADAAAQADTVQTGRTIADWAIEEVPIALRYNGLPYAVMMATPTDLEDFALGFALCEGIVADAREFALVDIVRSAEGVALHAAIPQARFDTLQSRARGTEGPSGCGLCGVRELESALRPAPHVGAGPRVSAAQVHAGMAALARQQPLNARSGGVHAAGFVACHDAAPPPAHDGDANNGMDREIDAADARIALRCVREDVGRHNALDKLVGALHRDDARFAPDTGFLAITSRTSYEIVQKAAHAGIAVIAAVSAPTALAIRRAEDCGITLIGFARGGRMNVYCGAERVIAQAASTP